MRTSIDINDKLLRRAKKHALDNDLTLKEVVEEGLRRVVDNGAPLKKPYVFDLPTVRGEGLQEGLREGDWDAICDLLYPVPEEFQK